MILKKCSRKTCKNPWKDISEFYKDRSRNDGLTIYCIDCISENYNLKKNNKLEYQKKYREAHKEEKKEKDKKYRKEHGDELKEYHKNYSEEHKDEKKEYKKNYYIKNNKEIKENKKKKSLLLENKEKRNKYEKERKENDFEYKLIHNLRTNFYNAMKKYSSTGKIQSNCKYGINYKEIIEKLGFPMEHIINPHIDHIFPVSAFNHNDQIEIAACWAPQNLRWLSAEENIKKNNKYNKEEFKKYLENFKSNYLSNNINKNK